MAIQTFTLDPNAAALEQSFKNIRNATGGGLVANDLVYITSWDETNARFLVAKAIATALSTSAVLVMRGALADITNGSAYRTWRTTATLNTLGSTVGAPVYLSPTTAGSWTLTKPTGADEVVQIIGRVAVVSATLGVIEFDLVGANAVEAIGSSELQSNAVTNLKLTTTAAQENLDGLSDTARKYIRTGPGVGEFKVITVQRDATGKLEVTYDDVAQ